MNLMDSFFLCLDIGTSTVRGIAHHVRGGNIAKSATYTVENYDTVFALKSVIDELERNIGAHFDSAYITGNFGNSIFKMSQNNTTWGGEHKISPADIRTHISEIPRPDDMYPMHIVPLRYATPTMRDLPTPVGFTDRQLISVFGTIFYENERINEIMGFLRRAHIQANAFFDPHFVQNATLRGKDETVMFLDLGAMFTSVSIWTPRGPVFHTKIPMGGTFISREISEKLNIDFYEAMRIKHSAMRMMPMEMDRFTPADAAYEFSRADINDIVSPIISDIMSQIKSATGDAIEKRKPVKIIITGGGAEIPDMDRFIEHSFAIPVVRMGGDTTIRAISDFVWAGEAQHRAAYVARNKRMRARLEKITKIFHRRKRVKRPKFIPIMPSTLCFDMNEKSTYSLFASGGISMIHVDIMDGFYVNRIAGSISELQQIRGHTRDHLHVHLMTQAPTVWAADAIAAGADTIILSTGTAGLRAALTQIRTSGRRCGVALNPESSVELLKPILRDIDEVMIMAVPPGAAGQEFNDTVLNKIKVLNATRKKYNLKLTISVDGGINAETAAKCWAAGADLLVSGSYLGRANDFPLAVQSLLPSAQK